MPISGLVVTLAEDQAAQDAAVAAMSAHPAIEIGTRSFNQMPVVVETVDEEQDRLIWEWLHALPGVVMVVVALIHFDDERSSCESCCTALSSPHEESDASLEREP
jgi:hypothetical protein